MIIEETGWYEANNGRRAIIHFMMNGKNGTNNGLPRRHSAADSQGTEACRR
jgi:hypothetical protein